MLTARITIHIKASIFQSIFYIYIYIISISEGLILEFLEVTPHKFMATLKNEIQLKNTVEDQNDEKDLIELCQQMKFSKVQSNLYGDDEKNQIQSNMLLLNQRGQEKNSSKNRFLTSLNQKISSKQNILSCLQQKKGKDEPDVLFKSNKLINENKLGQLQLKERNQLHKKINIFGNALNQTVPNIKFMKKSNLENASTFSFDSLLFIDTFSCDLNNETQKVSFLLSQRGDFTVFISSIKPQEGSRVRAKLHIGSPIKSLLYIEKSKIKDSFINMNSQKLICDKLLIGCQNGFIYIVNNLTQVLQNPIDIEFESDCQIDTNESEADRKSVDKIILDPYNISRIYVIKQGHYIKRYDYEPIKCEEKEIQRITVNLATKKKYIFKFMQFDPVIKLETQRAIICLRFIRIPLKQKVNEQKQKICLLVHLQGMYMPCILDNPDDIYFWFPGQLDRLATRYNKILEDISGTNKQWDGKHAQQVECWQKIANIKIIEYQYQTGKVIIGCNDGSIYFCSIKTTQQMLKIKLELDSSKIEDEYEKNSVLNQQINKYHCFPYLIVIDYAFKEGSNIHSLASIHNQAFVCIASDIKVLLYDTRNRVKFSKTLIQKPSNPINCVTWTIDQQLILSSTKLPSNRVYLYSNQLPIRKI